MVDLNTVPRVLILKEYKKMSTVSLILEFYIHMTSSVFSKILKQHNLQNSEDFNARSKSLETYLKYPQVHLIKSHIQCQSCMLCFICYASHLLSLLSDTVRCFIFFSLNQCFFLKHWSVKRRNSAALQYTRGCEVESETKISAGGYLDR